MKLSKKSIFVALLLSLVFMLPGFVVQAASPKLNKTSCSLDVGEKVKLKLKNAKGTVKWSSSNKKVATVNKNGRVTARKVGSAIIKAKYKNKTYECKIKVTDPHLSESDSFTLKLWCLSDGSKNGNSVYNSALEEMKEKYPNITVEVTSYENEEYKEVIRNASKNDELPDIFFSWTGGFLGDFVNAEQVYCLDKILKTNIKNKEISESALESTTYNGKHYGIPYSRDVILLFANMDVLKKAGYDKIPFPFTMDMFLEYCEKLKYEGITPMGCSGDETWCITEYLEPLILKLIGAEELQNIYSGKSSWDNKGIAQAVDMLQDMIRKGYFNSEGNELGSEDVRSNFESGDYAFYFSGTWNCGTFSEEALESITINRFPWIFDEEGHGFGNSPLDGQFIGGSTDALAVSSSSQYVNKVAEYAVELGKTISKYSYYYGSGLPTWSSGYDSGTLNSLLNAVRDIVWPDDKCVLAGDTAMGAEDAAIYLDCVKQVYNLEIDGNTFIKILKEKLW
ncbi:MAG: extracellular solute-binding protein [Lachnospiraceae bacterium]|nr:extracellular solute-binding protein [Lachnospiraceae bacterium]